MPSKISVKSLRRISIPAGEAEPSSRIALAAFGTSGSTFQPLIPNHKAIARKPKDLQTIAVIEKEEQVARFHLLAQFSLHHSNQTLE